MFQTTPRLVLVCLLSLLAAQSALASGGSRRAQVEVAPVESEAVLKEVYQAMTQELAQVELVLAEGKNGEAFAQAKSTLDRARVRSGIQPKANTREKVEIRGVLDEADLKKTFTSLSNRQRDAVATTVLNYRGRLYFDVLNQMKRANLLYVRAMVAKLKEGGGTLLSGDIEKIRADLLAAYRVPVLVRQEDLSGDYLLFDSDVSNSDQHYFFNREIKVYAMGLAELKFTEEAFDRAAIQFTQGLERTHWSGFVTRAEVAAAEAAARKAQADRAWAARQAAFDRCVEEEEDRIRRPLISWGSSAVGDMGRALCDVIPCPSIRKKNPRDQARDACASRHNLS